MAEAFNDLTLPAANPHIRLDYVFVQKNQQSRVMTCEVVKDPAALTASDHLPVVADLHLH